MASINLLTKKLPLQISKIKIALNKDYLRPIKPKSSSRVQPKERSLIIKANPNSKS